MCTHGQMECEQHIHCRVQASSKPPSQIPEELFSAGYIFSSLSCEVLGRMDGSNLCITALASSAKLIPNGKQVCSLSGTDVWVGRRRQDKRLKITPTVR